MDLFRGGFLIYSKLSHKKFKLPEMPLTLIVLFRTMYTNYAAELGLNSVADSIGDHLVAGQKIRRNVKWQSMY